MSAISFFVPGIPKPAGSKRAFALRKAGVLTGRVAVVDASKGSKDWKGDVKRFASEEYKGPLLDGPLKVTFTFYIGRPKGHFRKNGLSNSAPAYPTIRPDLLKYARAVEDACTGVIWSDDSQIVTEVLKKRYVRNLFQTPGVLFQTPGVMVEIEAEPPP